MAEAAWNVLFLCTGNSARSIRAEAIVDKLGEGRFRGFSAGSHPVGRVNPHAERELRLLGVDPASYRSKSWDEFAAPGAPRLDFVITVCDNAAGEACPVWPGRPVTAHWGLPDPAAVVGDEATKQVAFAEVARQLRTRIGCLVALPIEKLERGALQERVRDLGRAVDAGLEPQSHGADVEVQRFDRAGLTGYLQARRKVRDEMDR